MMLDRKIVVLVVEDHHLILMATIDALTDAGFEALAARNAEDAIRLLEEHPDIHLVFTDVEVGGTTDGLMLSHYIRNRWPPVHLIVTSGKTMVDGSVLPAGARFFPKPYGHFAIVEAINEMILN
jgi:two-component system, response regulator PdtaR